MPVACGLCLLCIWPCCYAASSAIIAYAVAGPVINYRAVNISIMDHRGVHMYYSSIVAETASLPSAACKTGTEVAVAIVYTAIKANMRTPVTLVKYVNAAIIAPITRSP